jgi:hypothetical protein
MECRPEGFTQQKEYYADSVPCKVHGNRQTTICVSPGEKAEPKNYYLEKYI